MRVCPCKNRDFPVERLGRTGQQTQQGKEHMHKGVASRTAVRGKRIALQARRTGGGERRRKSECGSAERFVVSPEEVGSLCVISKVSSEAQRRLARSSDTRRGQRTLQRQRGNKLASLRPLCASQGNSSRFLVVQCHHLARVPRLLASALGPRTTYSPPGTRSARRCARNTQQVREKSCTLHCGEGGREEKGTRWHVV